MKKLFTGKLYALAVAVCMTVQLMPAYAFADADSNKLTISTAQELAAFRDKVNSGNNYNGKTVALDGDIDLETSADAPWTPIGSEAVPFMGTFDGGGHEISGLYINTNAGFQGLFGSVGEGGTVKNLTVDGEVTGRNIVGGVAGQSYGTLENCGSSVNVAASYGTSGGVTGRNGGDVKGCYNIGSVKFINENPEGGENSFGGVVGDNSGGTVENCYNTGSVEGYQTAGGVVGNVNGGSVKNSYNTGPVTGGYMVGGVIGQNNYTELINCYNIGSVTGVKSVDGITGGNYNSVVKNCFCLAGSAAASVYGKTLTEEQLEDQSTFTNAGWDFGSAWVMDSWIGRPVLQSPREYYGAGTKDDPYLIPGLEALESFRDKVNGGNSYEGIYIKLAADIDLSGKYGADIGGAEVSWTPIGSDTAPFEGIFSGGGHEISGLYINNSTAKHRGLFGYLGEGGVIGELSVSGSVTGGESTGGIAGAYAGTVTDCFADISVSGAAGSGCIAGSGSGTVSDCISIGTPSGSAAVIASGGTVSNCFFNSDIYTGEAGTEGVTGLTADEFASGMAAWLLSGNRGGVVWGQDITSETKEPYPVLTDDANKKVYKVTFMVKDRETGEYAEYAESYINAGRTAVLPQTPASERYEFIKWSFTQDENGDEFTSETAVNGDLTIYAIERALFGASDAEKIIETVYGTEKQQDLSAYMEYADGTPAGGRFAYEICGGSINDENLTENGNKLEASIDGDILTIPAGTNADTYTLRIKASEKEQQTAELQAEYGMDPVEFDVTVKIAAAVPTVSELPLAERVHRDHMLSESDISGGTVVGIDGVTPLDGTWSWKNDREMTENGTFEETAVFTPSDKNYAAVEAGGISVTVYWTSTGGGVPVFYRVTFDSMGGSSVTNKTVTRNARVSKPADPTRKGYIFDGWYTDEDCTEKYSFDTKITKNITLYAKWIPENEPTATPKPTPKPTEEPGWRNPFNDVSTGDWFYDAVKYANENGLFSGVTSNRFEPNTPITRGMLVTVLWRSENEPVVNYLMTFEDVDQEAYYAEAVRWAASERIVTGYSDAEFAPDKLITREEFAAVTERFAEYIGMDTSERGNLEVFDDAYTIGEWARENVSWAVGAGLLNGKGGGKLDPKGSTTRAEAAAILQRLFEG